MVNPDTPGSDPATGLGVSQANAAASGQDPLLEIRASPQHQAHQAVLASFASLTARLQSLPAPSAASSSVTGSSVPPNFVDPDNSAGDLSIRRNNPIQRPAHLCDDDAVPTLFDLSNHSGVRRVKAVLGTHAAFEIETLGCALNWQFDQAAAVVEIILEAVKRLPPSGPNKSVTAEHSGLVQRLEKVGKSMQAGLEIIEDRFSLLTASSASPNNRNLLNALSSKVRSLAFKEQIPSARVRTAVQDLETQRAAALFKAAAQYEAQKSPSGGHSGSEGGRTHHRFQPGRGGRGSRGGRGAGRGGRGSVLDSSRSEDSTGPS